MKTSRQTARIAPLLAAAAAALALLPSSQGAAQASPAPVALHAAGTWNTDDLGGGARRNFTADLGQILPAARPVVELVDGSVAIDRDVAPCKGFGDSCSFPAPAGSSTPWRIHFSDDVIGGTYASQRFVVYHEIGHAVWDLVLRPSDRQAFVDAFQAGLHGAPCKGFRTGRPCAAIQELFADEFARWAGGFRICMTTYETPAAVPAATMTAIIGTALAARA